MSLSRLSRLRSIGLTILTILLPGSLSLITCVALASHSLGIPADRTSEEQINEGPEEPRHLNVPQAEPADEAGDTEDVQEDADDASAISENDEPSAQSQEKTAVADPVSHPFTAILRARVYTQSTLGVLNDSTVLIQGDKIVGIGHELDIPDNAQLIDADGLHLVPGFIDLRSRFGLGGEANVSLSDGSGKVLDGFNNYNQDHESLWAQGITAVYIQPGNSSLFGGLGSALSVDQSSSIDALLLNKAAGFQAALTGTSPNVRARFAEYERLKKALQSAVDYKKKWDEYNAYLEKQQSKKKEKENDTGDSTRSSEGGNASTKAASQDSAAKDSPAPLKGSRRGGRSEAAASGSKPADKAASEKPAEKDKEKPVRKPDFNPVLDRLVPLVSGVIPLRFEVHSATDAANAARFIIDFPELQIVFEGLSNVGSVARDLSDARRPLVLGPWLDSQRSRVDHPDRVLNWSRKFFQHEGPLVIATFANSSADSSWLRMHAIAAVAAGLSRERALDAITLHPARLLGLDQQLGSIEVGKTADLVLFDGDPLDAASSVRWLAIKGETKVPLKSDLEKHRIPLATEMTTEIATGSKSLALPERLPNAFALKSSNVWTQDKGFQPKTIVVRRGRIARIVDDAESVNPRLLVLDMGALPITAGLVSAHSTLGLGSLFDQAADSDASNLVASDAFDRQSDAVRQLVDGGFTRVVFSPPSRATLSGQASLIRLNSDGEAEMGFPKISLTTSARITNEYPSSLTSQLDLIRSALDGRPSLGRLYVPEILAGELSQQRVERAAQAAGDKQPLFIQANLNSEIVAAIDLSRSLKTPLVLVFPNQLRPFLDDLVELNAAIIMRPLRANDPPWFLSDTVEAIRKGLAVHIAGDSPIDIRLTASQLVASGVPECLVLNALQSWPIESADSEAVLSRDSVADLVVWSGNPLDLSSRPLQVIVDGQLAERLPSTAQLMRQTHRLEAMSSGNGIRSTASSMSTGVSMSTEIENSPCPREPVHK